MQMNGERNSGNKQTQGLTRRGFMARSLGVGLASSVIATSRTKAVLGANNRIRLGFIGIGNRGSQLLDGFLANEDAEVAALCDVYSPYLYRDSSMVSPTVLKELGGRIPKMQETLGKNVSRHKDFRELLEQKDLDAVVIATPDHWHAIQTIQACESGKDVYVEKPLTATIVEGRKMVEAAKRTKRVVQVGLQRRSANVYSRLADEVQGGKIGKVTVARAYRISNMDPAGIGRAKPSNPPEDFDWDMWLGPRAYIQYQSNIHPYKFRWWQDYSSQAGNWGVHYFDAIRLVMGEQAPASVTAHGGRFAVDDDRTIPDTMEVVCEFGSKSLLIFGQYEASGGSALESGEIELRGTLGNIYSSQNGYKVIGSTGGQFQESEPRIEDEEVKPERRDSTSDHIRDFLDCVKSREECNCSLEEGHRSTTFAHLANISLALKVRIEWDPVAEKIISPKEANELLHYDYRKPWSL